eukprot:TRINITY_DN41296_c0_g1_i1.p1 TRINITY_DN41296_c0_g1~~TRINITY_DN41296_c0_g1_i1.p1  ORF type:complete len:424 (-),score=178.99 TRINITY_DN41296_c0_g1_i1:59-1330(-)
MCIRDRVKKNGRAPREEYQELIRHCAKASDMTAAVYLWHKMPSAKLKHQPDDYKLLHPLHGKRMEDSKAFQNVPALPAWVKNTKREIHEILTKQELDAKKERSMDKLPIVITELLKIEDHGWARVFENTNALAQFLARKCKLKESQARPLVSVMRDAELLTELGDGSKTSGDLSTKKKVRVASKEKLISVAKSLANAAKEVAKDEEVEDDKRAVAKLTSRQLRLGICQGVAAAKEEKKAKEEKPWEQRQKDREKKKRKLEEGQDQDPDEDHDEDQHRDEDQDEEQPEGDISDDAEEVVDAPEEKPKKKKKKQPVEEAVEPAAAVEVPSNKPKAKKQPAADEAEEAPTTKVTAKKAKAKKTAEVPAKKEKKVREPKKKVEEEFEVDNSNGLADDHEDQEGEVDDRDTEPVYHTDADLMAAFNAL